MRATGASPAGVFDVLAENVSGARDHVTEHGDDIALLIRSSGTTASAKIGPTHCAGALIAHGSTSIVDMVNLRPEDRCFNARPMHHVHAIAHVVGASLVAGASIVCPTPDRCCDAGGRAAQPTNPRGIRRRRRCIATCFRPFSVPYDGAGRAFCCASSDRRRRRSIRNLRLISKPRSARPCCKVTGRAKQAGSCAQPAAAGA